jgi:hypothetical protein
MAAPLGNKNYLGYKYSLASRKQMSEVEGASIIPLPASLKRAN